MKFPNLLAKTFVSIFILFLLSSRISAQTTEFAKIRIHDLNLGKTYVYIYYGDSQTKEHSFKASDAYDGLINILNGMGNDGWKIVSSALDKNKYLIIFMERTKK